MTRSNVALQPMPRISGMICTKAMDGLSMCTLPWLLGDLCRQAERATLAYAVTD